MFIIIFWAVRGGWQPTPVRQAAPSTGHEGYEDRVDLYGGAAGRTTTGPSSCLGSPVSQRLDAPENQRDTPVG